MTYYQADLTEEGAKPRLHDTDWAEYEIETAIPETSCAIPGTLETEEIHWEIFRHHNHHNLLIVKVIV